ncbi:hypothetical protein ALC53_05399 [Atta colombica]|uniref:Uncharacterized protein n=1 Tax=Atta colombica TaxID=520822 RepID=A0A195BIS0_9HYME|nr:hypothetical protein ALC53_05399 [Atta colombica]
MRGLLHRVSCRIDTACTGVHNPASNDPPSHPTTLSIATGSYLRVPVVGATEYPEMSTGWGSDLTFREIQLTEARLKVGVIVDGSASHNREMG